MGAEPISYDDQLKLATIEKTLAEAKRINSEVATAQQGAKRGQWVEPLKLFGAAVLGGGGLFAAYTQYEVAELKAKHANFELSVAAAAKSVAETETKEAQEKLAKSKEAVRLSSAELETSRNALTKAQRELATIKASEFDAAREREKALRERDDIRASIQPLKQELLSLTERLEAAKSQARSTVSSFEDQILAGLKPSAAELAKKLLLAARAQGMEVRLISGYRSPTDQDKLFRQGRFGDSGPVVTNARGGFSVHNTGLAFDVITLKNGAQSEDKAAIEALGRLGESLGLVWGGEFKPYGDAPHFQTQDAAEAMRQLRESYFKDKQGDKSP